MNNFEEQVKLHGDTTKNTSVTPRTAGESLAFNDLVYAHPLSNTDPEFRDVVLKFTGALGQVPLGYVIHNHDGSVEGDCISVQMDELVKAAAASLQASQPIGITFSGMNLVYTETDGTVTSVDASALFDDTNLSMIVSGTLAADGSLTLLRDDGTAIVVDASALLDNTNLARITSGSLNAASDTITVVRDDATDFDIDVTALNQSAGVAANASDISDLQSGQVTQDAAISALGLDQTTQNAAIAANLAANMLNATNIASNDTDIAALQVDAGNAYNAAAFNQLTCSLVLTDKDGDDTIIPITNLSTGFDATTLPSGTAINLLGHDANGKLVPAEVTSENTPSLVCNTPLLTQFPAGGANVSAYETSASPINGYIMYSFENVTTRFPSTAYDPDHFPNLTAVTFDGTNWIAIGNANTTPTETFTPVSTDFLISINVFSSPAESQPFAVDGTTNGIRHVADYGGAFVRPNFFNGLPNTGEFAVENFLEIVPMQMRRLQLDGTYLQESDNSVHTVEDTIADGFFACDPQMAQPSSDACNTAITGTDGGIYAMPLIETRCYNETMPSSTLVFRQDLSPATGNFFNSRDETASFDENNADPATATKYSILNQSQGTPWSDGDYRFRLVYPSIGAEFTFSQTSHILDGPDDTVTGFNLISAIGGSPSTFGGLSITEALATNTGSGAWINGNPGSTDWWFAAGIRRFFGPLGIPSIRVPTTSTDVVEIYIINELGVSDQEKITVNTYSDGTNTKLVGSIAGSPLLLDLTNGIPNSWVEIVNVFGENAEDFIDTDNVNITSAVPTLLRSFSTFEKPAGRYRIQMTWQYEPAAAGSNTRFNLAVDGTQIGLEYEDEGKDVGADIRRVRTIVGYYDHTTESTFDIELFASRQAGTGVLHGVQAEVWRVS